MSERTERGSMTNDRDDAIKRAIELCHMTQCMIDITAKQLDGLRTVCSTSEEITQKEIRESEVRACCITSITTTSQRNGVATM